MQKESEVFTPSYKVLETSESDKQRHLFPTIPDKICEAERLKSLGNELFKLKDYKQAMSCYHKIFFMINGIMDPKDEYSKYSKDKNEVPTPEILQIVKDLKYAVFLNMSQIDIFNKNYKKAAERASKSLEIKESLKGLYRRGCAYIELNEFEKARKDLERVRAMENEAGAEKNEELEKKFAAIKIKEKACDQEMKNKLKKMFI